MVKVNSFPRFTLAALLSAQSVPRKDVDSVCNLPLTGLNSTQAILYKDAGFKRLPTVQAHIPFYPL